ncbi:hypothetical protein JZ751_007415 [Albula glossodonta]|uniref:Uncharacterized protein n=1 Tax=Albula glossodonta TaxID=121402 RepID=A0A8T2N3F5_9TELE|nr:hypothetical protein JZ751_007415 [Albula glossodonta]
MTVTMDGPYSKLIWPCASLTPVSHTAGCGSSLEYLSESAGGLQCSDTEREVLTLYWRSSEEQQRSSRDGAQRHSVLLESDPAHCYWFSRCPRFSIYLCIERNRCDHPLFGFLSRIRNRTSGIGVSYLVPRKATQRGERTQAGHPDPHNDLYADLDLQNMSPDYNTLQSVGDADKPSTWQDNSTRGVYEAIN